MKRSIRPFPRRPRIAGQWEPWSETITKEMRDAAQGKEGGGNSAVLPLADASKDGGALSSDLRLRPALLLRGVPRAGWLVGGGEWGVPRRKEGGGESGRLGGRVVWLPKWRTFVAAASVSYRTFARKGPPVSAKRWARTCPAARSFPSGSARCSLRTVVSFFRLVGNLVDQRHTST